VYGIQVGMVDTTPPKKPTINTTDDNDKLITGSAKPKSKIYVYRGSSLLKTALVDSNGKYSIHIPVQKAGTVLTVFSEDAAKHVSPSAIIKVIDKTAPGVPTVHPVDDIDTSVKGKAESIK
jgi:Bacterial Ig domain